MPVAHQPRLERAPTRSQTKGGGGDRLRGDGDAARRKHAADLQRVLKANEELQAQLRALHVVVGRVVASEQHRVGVGGGSARKRGVARAAVRPA